MLPLFRAVLTFCSTNRLFTLLESESLLSIPCKKAYVSPPKNTEEWVGLTKEFNNEWNFPNCFGALDGKHIMIECPHNAGSMTFNYKNFDSLVLMAICDGRYCFTFVDIGSVGSEIDFAIFMNSMFGKAFHSLNEARNP